MCSHRFLAERVIGSRLRLHGEVSGGANFAHEQNRASHMFRPCPELVLASWRHGSSAVFQRIVKTEGFHELKRKSGPFSPPAIDALTKKTQQVNSHLRGLR